jgi:7,8-dihydropterin-6-yl-methyl-4-(beta-D-ribofuranosyl)aminobenzene 5'-phosphate synthase
MTTKRQTPFTAPVVDHLAVRVVVDSRYENILPKETHKFVKIEHVGDIPGKLMSTLAAEWGLSLHLESMVGGARAEYLLDFGYTPEIINRNIDLLDIDPARLNGLVLSHGHLDHYGGLDGFLLRHRPAMKDDAALYVGGEGAFAERWVEDEQKEKQGGEPAVVCWGALTRASLLTHAITPVCCPTPHVLEGGFTSGYIERNSFEDTTSHTLVESPDHFTEAERRGRLVTDNHPEEHALSYIVRGRGLVVISSCGHIGIVNSVKSAMAVSGIDKLHAVIGGFHLAASKQDYIDHTVDALAELNPDVVLPMHCTGRDFIETMRRRLPEKLIFSNLGSRYTFGV